MNPWKAGTPWVVGIAALVALCGALAVGSPFWGAFVAKHTAGARVEQRVYSPDNIIGQVAFFTQTCEDVGRDFRVWKTNDEAYLRAVALAGTSRDAGAQAQAQSDASEYSTYTAGALTNLQSDAADYDARSINYTASPFKTAGLPYRIAVPADPGDWTPPSCG